MISALLKCHTGQCHDVIFALHYCQRETRCQQKISFMLGFLYVSQTVVFEIIFMSHYSDEKLKKTNSKKILNWSHRGG